MRWALDRHYFYQCHYLDHTADQLDKSGGVVVGSFFIEDHIAGHAGSVEEDIVVAVEDMLPTPHVECNDAAKGPNVRSRAVRLTSGPM